MKWWTAGSADSTSRKNNVWMPTIVEICTILRYIKIYQDQHAHKTMSQAKYWRSLSSPANIWISKKAHLWHEDISGFTVLEIAQAGPSGLIFLDVQDIFTGIQKKKKKTTFGWCFTSPRCEDGTSLRGFPRQGEVANRPDHEVRSDQAADVSGAFRYNGELTGWLNPGYLGRCHPRSTESECARGVEPDTKRAFCIIYCMLLCIWNLAWCSPLCFHSWEFSETTRYSLVIAAYQYHFFLPEATPLGLQIRVFCRQNAAAMYRLQEC